MAGEFNRADSGSIKSRLIVSSQSGEQGAIFIDLLIALGLSLVIMGILQQLVVLVYAAHINNSHQADLQYSARMAVDCIQRDIRCARDFKVSPNGSVLMITDTEGRNIRIFIRNHHLYRKEVSSIAVADNLMTAHFHKSSAVLRGELELADSKSNYGLDFFCFARTLKAQDETIQ